VYAHDSNTTVFSLVVAGKYRVHSAT